MQDRPTATELLTTIAGVLDQDVLPAVEPALKHRVRVAANLCQILAREAELGPDQDQRERELLAAILGRPSSSDTLELTRELTERLDKGDDRELQRKAWHALNEIVRGKLAVAKPGHDSYDFAAEAE